MTDWGVGSSLRRVCAPAGALFALGLVFAVSVSAAPSPDPPPLPRPAPPKSQPVQPTVTVVVRPEHLAGALAVWDYAEASTRRLFGDRLGIPDADHLAAVVRARGSMTRTAIRDLFGRNKSTEEIDALLELVMQKGKIRKALSASDGKAGRPTETWEAVP